MQLRKLYATNVSSKEESRYFLIYHYITAFQFIHFRFSNNKKNIEFYILYWW